MADSRSLLRMEQILGKGRESYPLAIVLSHALLAQTTFFAPRSASPLHSNPHTPLGTPDDPILEVANFLHSLISPLFPPQAQLYVDLIAQLLAKDRLNSFCLMDPYFPDGLTMWTVLMMIMNTAIEENWDGGENKSDLPRVRFLSKYVCGRKNCAGTMAPLPPKDDVPSNVLEYNLCGNLKNIDAA
ncbi:Histone-lysine N-methyltransferase ASHR2 [Glycine soja]|nr:Histone-lysine N-methyltransferase ASHR2 [Glycine soja]